MSCFLFCLCRNIPAAGRFLLSDMCLSKAVGKASGIKCGHINVRCAKVIKKDLIYK